MRTCCLIDPSLRYSTEAPFHPSEKFPEFSSDARLQLGDNPLHGALRRVFHAAGLDSGRFGSAQWNPLRNWVQPGQRVVIKPNWVREPLTQQRCLITEGAFLRAVLDYVALALEGRGTITICDAPVQSGDFASILRHTGASDIVSAVARPELDVRVVDLRRQMAEVDATGCKILQYRPLSGDPSGYAAVDLGARSYLEPLCHDVPNLAFYSPHYDVHVTNESHRPGVHRYDISRSVLEADVFINLPKMKTHKKSGVTGALKNLVGINGSKDGVVHFHRAPGGGDEVARRTLMGSAARFADSHLRSRLPVPLWGALHAAWRLYKSRLFRKARAGQDAAESLLSFAGSWYGNQTIWRMIYDLNTILFFADRDGRLSPERKRKVLILVDGVVAGEGEGPLSPQPRAEGIIVLGDDPIAVDACLARLMHFDERLLPILSRAAALQAPFVFSEYANEVPCFVGERQGVPPFVPPATWLRHIEAAAASGAR